jgi:hypothetical protein
LPEHLKSVSAKFYELACSLCALVEPGPERIVALQKLLEAKDAAVWRSLADKQRRPTILGTITEAYQDDTRS